MDEKTVIFNHIPKNAGLTLSSILEKQYSKKRIFSTLGWKGGRNEAIDYFMNLSDFERSQYDLITGHSALKLLKVVKFPITLIMLRDPVDRVLSLYSYVRRKTWHKFHQVTNCYTLSECFENNIHNEWKELSNGQLTSLASSIDNINIKELNDATNDIEKVKLFIKNNCIVGFVEKFDESLVLFKEHLSWKKNMYYYKINVSMNKSEYNHEIREIILNYNKDDYALYTFALKCYEDSVKDMEKSFKMKVRSFKSKNKLIMPIKVFLNRFNYYIRRAFEKLRSMVSIS